MRRSRWSAMTCVGDENRCLTAVAAGSSRCAPGPLRQPLALPSSRSTPTAVGTIDEDLRPVPRTHQPLGRGWSLRGADPRRRIRGPRLRDVLDTIWPAGRGARRRHPVRAWDEKRADHRRPPAAGIRQRRVFLESGRSYDGSVWIKVESGAPRVSLRVLAADGSVLADLPLRRADRRGRKCPSRSRARAPIATRRSRSPPPDAAPCSSTSSR